MPQDCDNRQPIDGWWGSSRFTAWVLSQQNPVQKLVPMNIFCQCMDPLVEEKSKGATRSFQISSG